MQTMPNITMVTDTNFDSVVAESQKPVLLAIGAQWCPDCRRLQPLFMQFAKDYSDKLVFASCDFDNNHGITEKYNADIAEALNITIPEDMVAIEN